MAESIAEKAKVIRATDRVYGTLKEMAITYQFRPGDRINEVVLARELNISRTPLREALNRLASEGFLKTLPNKGYFAARLDPSDIFDLYEFRACIEQSAVRLACRRASNEEIEGIREFVLANRAEAEDLPARKLLSADEEFHRRVAKLSNNKKLIQEIESIAARIHFFRWIDLNTRQQDQGGHLKILDLIESGDEASAAAYMEKHILRRMDQITDMTRAALAEIYLRPPGDNGIPVLVT